MENTNEAAKMKEAAGRAAVDALVKPGMKLGLGTGSTAIFAIRRVAELLADGTLHGISVFPTSFQTEIECEKLGIPCYTLNSAKLSGSLDLTIDGADEVGPENFLTKGGGGALLMEKIAAYSSALYAITVDETKIAEHLGLNFPVPVEVISEARLTAAKSIEKLGAEVILREAVRKAGPVITEHGNLIMDIRFSSPPEADVLETALNQIPGVVENGFFTRIRPIVFIARRDGTVEVRK